VRNAQIRIGEIDTSDEKEKYMFTEYVFCARIQLIGNVTDTDTENGADNGSKIWKSQITRKGDKNEKEIT